VGFREGAPGSASSPQPQRPHLHYGCPPYLWGSRTTKPTSTAPESDPLTLVPSLALPQATDTRLRPLLRSLVNLETLSLHGCKQATDKSMHEVAELTRLTSLDVGSTKIRDDGAVAISRLPNLTSLRMGCTYALSVRGYEALGRMPALTYLDANVCFGTDACLYALGGLVGLQYLDIGHWQLTHMGLDALINFPSLTYLNLERNKTLTSADGMKALAELTSLQSLNLNDCPMVTDQSLSMLSSLQQLETLSLGAGAKARASQITKLDALHGLASLRVVHLMHCPRMTDQGLSALPKHVRVNHSYGCDRVKGTYDGLG
jgi:internalin A